MASTSTCVLLLLLSLVISAPRMTSGSFPCVPVIAPLVPCLATLSSRNGSANPTEVCCSGIAAVAERAKSSPGRLFVCECIKILINQFPRISSQSANNVAAKCKVTFTFPDPYANCTLFN